MHLCSREETSQPQILRVVVRRGSGGETAWAGIFSPRTLPHHNSIIPSSGRATAATRLILSHLSLPPSSLNFFFPKRGKNFSFF